MDLAFTLLVGGISYIVVTLHYIDTNNYLQRLTTDPQHIQRRNDIGDNDDAGMWPTSTVRTI